MATRHVPGTYATIEAAMSAAAPGDTIVIHPDHVQEHVIVVTVNNLTFSGSAAGAHYTFTPGGSVRKISLGGDANYTIFGIGNSAVFRGNNGDNFLYDGGTGAGSNDTLIGGGGDDILQVSGGTDVVQGGGGTDRLIASFESSTSSVVMSAGSISAGASNSITHSGIEEFDITSGSGNDTLQGGAGFDALFGSDGDDTFIETAGQDGLDGGNGNDFFQLFGDGAFVGGGDGIDTIQASDLGSSLIGEVEVLDTMGVVRATAAQLSTFATITDSVGAADSQIIVNLHGAGGTLDFSTRIAGAHSVIVFDDGLTDGVTITGTKKGDRLHGSDLADTLNGGAGDDRLNGGSALNGVAFADVMKGGNGNDTFVVDEAVDEVIEKLGQGNDIVETTLASLQLAGHVENLTFVGTGDFSGTGNTLANRIAGGAGDDVLAGGVGGDVLIGGAGKDTASYANAAAGVTASLVNPAANTGDAAGDSYNSIANLQGSRHSDVLIGDGGNNVLTGGRGNDALTGGLGNDTFAFDQALVAGNVATIVDFAPASDPISLALAIFSEAGTAGPLAASAFFIGAAAHDANDRILYDSATGDLKYDADGTGAVAARTFAVLSPGLAVTRNDFVLV